MTVIFPGHFYILFRITMTESRCTKDLRHTPARALLTSFRIIGYCVCSESLSDIVTSLVDLDLCHSHIS